ncbi:cupin domain-containing protein [Microbulbifer sp. OS29]|uniref:Cupin domain-containing protein n=1 Tax=Microbulbifer okhotskensis TaxID=2926617 RepID=A0A9X2ELZ0_9GAMM|nr:cupin domain-containing protein [Microbulbifer okhotskensis]MCO1334684.1 cupin domain-containing protein [Microbulbifer okhotskensis]
MSQYILTKAEILDMEGEHKVHFLNPNAIRRNKSLGDLTGISGLGFHLIEIEPGRESTEFHCHHFEDECVYILEGLAEVRIGDDIHSVSNGDFIGYPAGGPPHVMRNVGEQTLHCIVVGQRLPHDVADYPDKNQRIYRNAGLPWELVNRADIEHPK